MINIPFNIPYSTGNEIKYIKNSIVNNHLSGDGYYTKKCSEWLENNIGCNKALLTQSGTAALEMAAILCDIAPGDEIIMPSYTFVSTANAFVLRGGVPVFVDINSQTKNIDENLIENAITNKTKAIVVVHYAGLSCEMDYIMEIAKKHNLIVIEDAAQAINSSYKGKKLGSIGNLGCLSFHETKNIQCGEGGALLINDKTLISRAEIIREKGTNRSQFYRGQVDKYTWKDIGSSFLPSEISAAFLYSQLENSIEITNYKLNIWNTYESFFTENFIEYKNKLNLKDMNHNAHIYNINMSSSNQRDIVIRKMKSLGISTTFHYIPLHSTDPGIKFGKSIGDMNVTNNVANTILRLPIYPNLNIDYVIDSLRKVFTTL
jgi:dTDP-4-amino-4,6-dideoxygalactose transaminase